MFSASCSVWALITVTLRCHHNGDERTKKNVTVKCNTAARQTRQIKTFKTWFNLLESCASLLYVRWTSELRNFKLDVFSHRLLSDSLAAKYCVLWQMPSSILLQQLQLQHYKRLTHSLHWWNFIASSNFSCIYYSFIIYITQYPVNKWKIII